MERLESQQSSVKVLEGFQKQIDELGKSPNQAATVCSEVSKRVKQNDHIGIIVALYNNKYLDNLFKATQVQYQQKSNQEIDQCLAVLYLYAYDCFFQYYSQFKTFFELFKPKISKIISDKAKNQLGLQNPRYKIMRQLLQTFGQYKQKCKQHKQQALRLLNEFIKSNLNINQPTTYFEQCVYTYIRIQIQRIQSDFLKTKQPNLCYYLHFQEGQSKKDVKVQNQNFKFALSPKDQKQSWDLIKGSIVSYMNCFGGMLSFGIKLNPQKQIKINGLALTKKQKVQFLTNVVREIMMKIYPSEYQLQQDEKLIKKKMQDKRDSLIKSFQARQINEYQITNHITVQFINLYDPKTWFYSRKQNNVKYIVRIKVKQGNQDQLYLFVNKDSLTEAYILRNNQQVKLNVVQYYEQLYRRLQAKEQRIKGSKEDDKGNCGCRFHQIIKENKQNSKKNQ